MDSIWTIYTDNNKEIAARKVVDKLLGQLNRTPELLQVEPHRTGGFEIIFHLDYRTKTWEQAVVACLGDAQKAGYAWQLSGTISTELILRSHKFSILGIQSIEVLLPQA